MADSVAEFKAALAVEALAREAARKDAAAMAERVRALESAVTTGTSEVGRLRSLVVVVLVLAVLMPLAVMAVIWLR